MCAPSPPKIKSPKITPPDPIDPYAGMEQDPEFKRAREELGITSLDSDEDVRQIRSRMIRNEFEDQTKGSGKESKMMMNAMRKLRKEGSVDKHINTDAELNQVYERYNTLQQNRYENKTDRAADRFAKQQKNQQKKQNKMLEKQQKASDAQFEKQLKQTQKDAKKDRKASDKQFKQQKKIWEQQAKDQEKQLKIQMKGLKDAMDQPVYSAKQAALPTVTAKPAKVEPIPTAPVAQEVKKASAAPPPEMVQMGDNNLAIVRQKKSKRASNMQRSRGTGSLINR